MTNFEITMLLLLYVAFGIGFILGYFYKDKEKSK